MEKGSEMSMAAPGSAGFSGTALRWSAILLVAASWISAAIFGAYILAFFGGTAARGAAVRWNESLPGLHKPGDWPATLAIGAHFLTGGTLLLLGPVQLVGRLRRAWPGLHRWLGRLYVVSALLAGLGGLGFIAARGTIGGPLMDFGFGIYGALMIVAAGMTFIHARARRLELHRAWAVRLFALAIGSWLYRLEYGFWFLAADGAGHNSDFRGWFDAIMMFFFYVPNLIVAELFIRARRGPPNAPIRFAASVALLAASGFIALATWFFTLQFWAPGMAAGLTGSPL